MPIPPPRCRPTRSSGWKRPPASCSPIAPIRRTRSCARCSSAQRTSRSARSTTSSAATSWWRCPRDTSGSRVTAGKPCASEGRQADAQHQAVGKNRTRRGDAMATDKAQAGGTPAIDLVDFIDGQPVGGFQIRLLLACAAVLFLDGFDTQAIGYVAPALAKEWPLTKGALGPVFSAGLFGLMIGALVIGPLADRVGRKKIIIFSTAAFGAGALATAFAQDVSALLLIRFLTGLGLGGAMPNAVALTSEYNPQRRRATMVMIMFCGFSIGAALGGVLAAGLIPRFGWRAVFMVGGIVPLVMLPLLIRALPESVRFLATAGRAPERVAALLKRISPHAAFAPNARFVVHETHLAGIPVGHLFREGRSPVTLLLWVVFFMSLLDIYFLANWLPTVLHDLGASVSAAALIGSMLQVGGVVGTFALGIVIDRFSFRALALVYFGAVFAVGAIGQVGHSA